MHSRPGSRVGGGGGRGRSLDDRKPTKTYILLTDKHGRDVPDHCLDHAPNPRTPLRGVLPSDHKSDARVGPPVGCM